MKTRLVNWPIVALAALTLQGCGYYPGSSSPAAAEASVIDIAVAPLRLSMRLGSTETLTATATNASGMAVDVLLSRQLSDP